MSLIIKDGTGSGKVVKVNSKNRMNVNAVQISDDSMAALEGKAYSIQTPVIELTSANASAVLYVKNTGTEDIIMTGLGVSFGVSTGGSGDVTLELVKNPTGGTIIDNTVDAVVENRNFGSSKTLSVNAYTGVEGDTMTGGTTFIISVRQAGQSIGADRTFIIAPGSSFGFKITPATGNTSMNVTPGVNVHLDGFGE